MTWNGRLFIAVIASYSYSFSACCPFFIPQRSKHLKAVALGLFEMLPVVARLIDEHLMDVSFELLSELLLSRRRAEHLAPRLERDLAARVTNAAYAQKLCAPGPGAA
jgi:hypothetical protein